MPLPKHNTVMPKIILCRQLKWALLLLNDSILNLRKYCLYMFKNGMVQKFTCVLLSFIEIRALYDITSWGLFVLSV